MLDLLTWLVVPITLCPKVKCKDDPLPGFIWGESGLVGKRVHGPASLSSLRVLVGDQPHPDQNTKPCSCVEQRPFLVSFSLESGYKLFYAYEPGLPQFPVFFACLFCLDTSFKSWVLILFPNPGANSELICFWPQCTCCLEHELGQ